MESGGKEFKEYSAGRSQMNTNVQLPSIETIKQRSQTKSNIWRICTEFPIISKQSQKEYLQSYFKLYWSAEYFLEQMKHGTITKEGRNYHVFFAHGITRGTIKQLDKGQQLELSFRVPLAMTDLPPVVFVSSTIIRYSE